MNYQGWIQIYKYSTSYFFLSEFTEFTQTSQDFMNNKIFFIILFFKILPFLNLYK